MNKKRLKLIHRLKNSKITKKRGLAIFFACMIVLFCLSFFPSLKDQVLAQSSNGNVKGWMWSSGVGWIQLDSNASNPVKVDSAGNFSGYAWSSGVGWINFNPEGPYPASGPQSGVKMSSSGDTRTITGWARACSVYISSACAGAVRDVNDPTKQDFSGWDGWINMSHATYDAQTQTFEGFSWGDLNLGWTKFFGAKCEGDNCPIATNDQPGISCSVDLNTVPGKVLWRAVYNGPENVSLDWDISSINCLPQSGPSAASASSVVGAQNKTSEFTVRSCLFDGNGVGIISACPAGVGTCTDSNTFLTATCETCLGSSCTPPPGCTTPPCSSGTRVVSCSAPTGTVIAGQDVAWTASFSNTLDSTTLSLFNWTLPSFTMSSHNGDNSTYVGKYADTASGSISGNSVTATLSDGSTINQDCPNVNVQAAVACIPRGDLLPDPANGAVCCGGITACDDGGPNDGRCVACDAACVASASFSGYIENNFTTSWPVESDSKATVNFEACSDGGPVTSEICVAEDKGVGDDGISRKYECATPPQLLDNNKATVKCNGSDCTNISTSNNVQVSVIFDYSDGSAVMSPTNVPQTGDTANYTYLLYFKQGDVRLNNNHPILVRLFGLTSGS